MEKETLKITAITPEDLAVVEQELLRTNRPLSTVELAEKLAFQKTASQRNQPVKVYDPYASYEIGDYIYREYDENLQVGSKVTEHFQGGVVLKVVNKVNYPSFNCEMLEVDYTGGGVFRRYIDYMKKTRTQVLLPSSLEGKALEPAFLEQEQDPRLSELPMTEKDLKILERSLRKSLSGSADLFSWNDFWQLSSKRVEISEEKIKEISQELISSVASESTQNLVRKHFNLEPSSDLFELYCLSLNHILEKKYRKEFICLSMKDWGKWQLKQVLASLPEGRPISSPLARVPDLGEAEGLQYTKAESFPVKIYLTWRDILSGAIKIPKSLARDFTAREYQLVDDEDGKVYIAYYYPEGNYLLGLADYFQANNIPQGTSLTLDKKGTEQFTFWIKKSKKKMVTLKLKYDPVSNRFQLASEEVFTLAMPNKSVYLEREVVEKLLTLYDECESLDLRQMLVKLFKTPELTTSTRSLHFMRAYQMADLLKATTAEDVEYILNNAPEFVASEKKEGIYIYQEAFEPKEAPAEEAEKVELSLLESLAEQLVSGEAEVGKPAAERIATETQIAGVRISEPAKEVERPAEIEVKKKEEEKIRAEIPVKAQPPGKQKPAKKKKAKVEEKGSKPRKSERRVIEEKIVEEESELEALEALKAQAEELEEGREAEEEAVPVEVEAAKQQPKFGFFAEMLKSALSKKQTEEKEEETEEGK
jgi:hypothetical protein